MSQFGFYATWHQVYQIFLSFADQSALQRDPITLFIHAIYYLQTYLVNCQRPKKTKQMESKVRICCQATTTLMILSIGKFKKIYIFFISSIWINSLKYFVKLRLNLIHRINIFLWFTCWFKNANSVFSSKWHILTKKYQLCA